MESKESFLKRLEIIEPLVNLQPVAWEAIKKQAQKANRSPRTIQRWIQAYRERGLEGLRNNRPPVATGRHVDWKGFVQQHYLSPKRLSIAAIHGLCSQRATQTQQPLPSYATVYRYIKEIPKSVMSYHRDRAEFNHKYKVSGDLIQPTYPGELYLIDHRKVDVLVYENGSKRTPTAKRPWITAVIDHYSRCLVGYYLSFEPPSSRRVALALRHCILPKNDHRWTMCGIPKAIRHDFGSDLISKHMQQIRMDLKIEWNRKEIANPRGDAIIERFFGTMAEWEHQCDGWVGRSLKHRPEKVAAKLTLGQFNQRFYDFVCKYHFRKHSSIQMTPFDRWNNGVLPRLPESVAVLDLLLMPVSRSHKIRRDGIHFQTNRYWCDELLKWIGETSQLRYDPLRLNEIIVFVGGKRVGNAFKLSGNRQTYMAYKRKRQKQAQHMREFVQPGTRESDDPIDPVLQDKVQLSLFPESQALLDLNTSQMSKQPPNKIFNPLPIIRDGNDWC